MLALTTPRLDLREFAEGDWASIHAYASDPEVVQYMLWGPNSEQDTAGYLRVVTAQQHEQPRRQFGLALVLRSSGALIGACGLSLRSESDRDGEIGYVLTRTYWGQGYMTEAARAMIGYGFDSLGLHRIYATCHPNNAGSARVLEKIGMRREGHLRRYKWAKGEWRDSLLYAILEDEWRTDHH